MGGEEQSKSWPVRTKLIQSVVIMIVAGLTAYLVYYYSGAGIVPAIFVTPIYVTITLIAGYLIIRIISTLIDRVVDPRLGLTRSHAIKNFFVIVASILLLIAAFSLYGFNVTNWLIGAGFIGIVLGLAAQQVISNLFAGVALLSSQPFDIGDRLTLIPAGYGIIGPSYNHENLASGYTGVVQDIGIFYTRITLDEGVPLVLPNSVVIGSLVMNHSKVRERTVRVRMDLEKKILFKDFKEEFSSLLKTNANDLIFPETLHVEIVDVGIQTYQVVMWLWTKSVFEEPVKTIIVQNALEAQKTLLARLEGEEQQQHSKA